MEKPKKMVNGVAVELSDAEIAEREAEELAWAAEKDKRDDAEILAKMEALEAKSLRALREAVLSGDKTKLQEIDSKIADLKSKLKRG